MDKRDKLLTSVGICCTAILFISFALTYVGIIDLRIVCEIEFNPWVEHLGNFAMFMINMFFMFSISFSIFDKKIIPIFLGYIPIYMILFIFEGKSLIASSLFPILYILLISILRYKNDINYILIRLGSFCFIIPLYQRISGYIKLDSMGFKYYSCNIATMFIYSIDLYLVFILMYCVVKNYGRSRQSIFRPFGFLARYCQEVLNQYRSQKEDATDLTTRQRRVFAFLAWGYVILQSFIVLGVNVALNKMLHFLGSFYIGAIELIVSWIALELCRLSLGKSFHSKNPKICNAISLTVFYIISRLALPIYVSLFFNIGLSAIIAFIIHRYVIKETIFNELKTYKQEREDYKTKSRRGKAEIILKTLSSTHIDYAMLNDYVDGETLDVLADKYNLSLSTLNRKINALTQK